MQGQGDPSRVSLWGGWRVLRRDVPFVGSIDSSFLVRKMKLTAVSGKGGKIR